MKILRIIIFYLLIVNNPVFSQLPPAKIASIDSRNEVGVADMTKTDLEHFMQTLIRLKQQRINQLYSQPYLVTDSTASYTAQELDYRMAKIEASILKLYYALEDPSSISQDTLQYSPERSPDLTELEYRLALLEEQLQFSSNPGQDSIWLSAAQVKEDQVTKAYLDQQIAEIYTYLEQQQVNKSKLDDESSDKQNDALSEDNEEDLNALQEELDQLNAKMNKLTNQTDKKKKVVKQESEPKGSKTSSELKSIERRLTLVELQLLAGYVVKNNKQVRDTSILPPGQLEDTLSVDSVNLEQQISELNAYLAAQSIDTIGGEKIEKSPADSSSIIIADDIKALRSELIELREQVAKLTNQLATEVPVAITAVPSIPTSSGEKEALEALKVRIQQQGIIKIFYGNNQTIISPDYQLILDRILDTLQRYEVLDILVVGYASKLGSTSYNQQIAAKRADLVKLYLMKKGIHPERIITQYYGIDHKAIQPKDARRVELNYLMEE